MTPAEVSPADLALLEQVTVVAEATLLRSSPHSRCYRVVDGAGHAFVVRLVHPDTVPRAVRLAAALAPYPAVDQVLVHGVVDAFGYLVTSGRRPWTDVVSGPLPCVRAAALLEGVGQALEALHRLGYVYGDVGPHSLAVDEEGSAALADLDAATPTGTVRRFWADPWAAPEVVRGEPATPATDRWAFALTLAAALLGSSALEALASGSVASALGALLPGPLAAALAADLDPDPARRDVPATTLTRLALAADLEVSGPARPTAAGDHWVPAGVPSGGVSSTGWDPSSEPALVEAPESVGEPALMGEPALVEEPTAVSPPRLRSAPLDPDDGVGLPGSQYGLPSVAPDAPLAPDAPEPTTTLRRRDLRLREAGHEVPPAAPGPAAVSPATRPTSTPDAPALALRGESLELPVEAAEPVSVAQVLRSAPVVAACAIAVALAVAALVLPGGLV